MLGAMFRGDIPATVDETGAYFIDRDGSLFGYILNFLRSSRLTVPEGFAQLEQLAVEADFFQIEPLIAAVKSLLKQKRRTASHKACKGGQTLEIIEMRMGKAATGFNPPLSRVNTIITGRGSVIDSLPEDIFAGPAEKRDQGAFIEVELCGSNVRLRLAEHLRGEGWQLVKSDMSFLQVPSPNPGNYIVERGFRDSWFLPVAS